MVDGERVSVTKKSHASGLATAQQEILQLTGVAFAISAVNLWIFSPLPISYPLFP